MQEGGVLYVNNRGSVVVHKYTMWQAYFSEAYANNVKCIHTQSCISAFINISTHICKGTRWIVVKCHVADG